MESRSAPLQGAVLAAVVLEARAERRVGLELAGQA